MIQDILKSVDERMDKSVQSLKKEFATVRAGRATPNLLDKVLVEYYGSTMPINQLANISTPEPRLLVIQPWDKGSLSAIEKAITKSDLGLVPTNDGAVIRISIPQLTEQRRQELVKQIRKMTEEGRVAVRNVRRDLNDEVKKIEKNGEISEDDSRRTQEKIQHATDKYIAEIDKLLAAKEKELLEV